VVWTLSRITRSWAQGKVLLHSAVAYMTQQPKYHSIPCTACKKTFSHPTSFSDQIYRGRGNRPIRNWTGRHSKYSSPALTRCPPQALGGYLNTKHPQLLPHSFTIFSCPVSVSFENCIAVPDDWTSVFVYRQHRSTSSCTHPARTPH
jgi:hypothetical protein